MSFPSRLFFSTRRRLYRRRGALFLINFLFGLAILGVYRHQGPEEDILSRWIASLRPLFAAPAAPYFHLRRGLLFSCARGARLLPNRWRGGSIDGLCHYLPAVVRWTAAS